MKKIRVSYALIGFILVAMGIILITEGGPHISHITYDELPQYTTQDMVDNSPCLLEYSGERDVVISVYRNNNNSFHILEFARNMIFNRYSLVDTHIYVASDQPFYSVVSTAFFDYAYCVDVSNFSIKIAERKISSRPFYSLFIISLGCTIIFLQKRSCTCTVGMSLGGSLMKRFDMMQAARKLTSFLKAHFPRSSSYHFLYGVLAIFLLYDGFSLGPVLNASRGLVIIVALISLLPLVLIPLFGGRKYLFGSGNWMVFGMVATLIVAACLGWLEASLVLFAIALGLGCILIQRFRK